MSQHRTLDEQRVPSRRLVLARLVAGASVLVLPSLWMSPAGAQAPDWPTRPIRVIVPYPAGGVIDVAVRRMTQAMASDFAQPFIVDNKPGANSNIAVQSVLDSPADGYTLLVTAPYFMVNPLTEEGLRWKSADFVPVARFALSSSVICVPATSSIRTLRELVDAAKKPPGLLYGDPGAGSTPTLAVRILAAETGAIIQYVPYRGAPPIVPDLSEGRLGLSSLPMSVALPAIKSGKLRALANVGDRRTPQLPDVATVAELGFPNATVYSWFGLHMRAGTPEAVVRRISTALGVAAAMPQVHTDLANVGIDSAFLGTADFASFLEKDRARMEPIVKATQVPAR